MKKRAETILDALPRRVAEITQFRAASRPRQADEKETPFFRFRFALTPTRQEGYEPLVDTAQEDKVEFDLLENFNLKFKGYLKYLHHLTHLLFIFFLLLLFNRDSILKINP